MHETDFTSGDFGDQFRWGLSSSAFQTEGADHADGKGKSIWDVFTEKPGKIKNGDHARSTALFYRKYLNDLNLIRKMNYNSFRFSLSWPRIFPTGRGYLNQMGIDFYNRIIDGCLENNITPWVTLYHWDLPQALEEKGGWTNRDIINRFMDFAHTASIQFGDRVSHWMVLNEPVSFTALGYFMGRHAPGRKGLNNFLPAVHHAALCQSLGARVLKSNIPNAEIGTCYAFAVIDPLNSKQRNINAASKLDVVFNRLFLEPALGLGYPSGDLPLLNRMEKYFLPGDLEILAFPFDFIGLQYYFRIVAEYSVFPPFIREVPAAKRDVDISTMKYEVYPEGIYTILKRLIAYKNMPKIIITESGVCYPDILLDDGTVDDQKRIEYFQRTLKMVLKAKQEHIPVEGYFVWSLTDNFEWAEGFDPRFGLVYVDYPSQRRFIKESGKWFTQFLTKSVNEKIIQYEKTNRIGNF